MIGQGENGGHEESMGLFQKSEQRTCDTNM